MNHLPTTYTIQRRTDTMEYLTHFEFWDRNSIKWSANVDEAFLFKSHSDSEINGRMVLEWLGDPLNRSVKLMHTKAEIKGGETIVGDWRLVNVTMAAAK
jgi:hypothetical protein